jgi:hypothetical protein
MRKCNFQYLLDLADLKLKELKNIEYKPENSFKYEKLNKEISEVLAKYEDVHMTGMCRCGR